MQEKLPEHPNSLTANAVADTHPLLLYTTNILISCKSNEKRIIREQKIFAANQLLIKRPTKRQTKNAERTPLASRIESHLTSIRNVTDRNKMEICVPIPIAARSAGSVVPQKAWKAPH